MRRGNRALHYETSIGGQNMRIVTARRLSGRNLLKYGIVAFI